MISLNDDKSPLIGLLNCIVCKETMKLEKSAPDAEGKDIIHYTRSRLPHSSGMFLHGLELPLRHCAQCLPLPRSLGCIRSPPNSPMKWSASARLPNQNT